MKSRYRRHDKGILYEGAKIVGKLHMAERSFVGQDAFVAGDVTLAAGAQINPHGMVIGKVELGECAVVSYGACVIATTYTTEGEYMCEASTERDDVRGAVIFERGAYLGANAVVCVSRRNPMIRIGQMAVVGALTYIDKSVPSNVVIHPRIATFTRRRNSRRHITVR